MAAGNHQIDISDGEVVRQCPEGFAGVRFRNRECFAEFFGTLILVLLGDGVIAQVTINKAAESSAWLSINLGFALALMMGIYVAGPVSGAHLNPAVTLANAVLRNFSWSKVPGYIFSQTLGAFTGAALVYANYWPAINAIDGGERSVIGPTGTGGIFATFPFPGAPPINSIVSEIIGTSLLLIGILAITDHRQKIPPYMAAPAIGLVLGSIGMSTGFMTGFALNPARDLGPRLFIAVAGWGYEAFKAVDNYFWIPLSAPFAGAIIGVLIYDSLICPYDVMDNH